MENNKKPLQWKTIRKRLGTTIPVTVPKSPKKSNKNQKKPVTVPKNPKFNGFRIFGLPPGPPSPSQAA